MSANKRCPVCDRETAADAAPSRDCEEAVCASCAESYAALMAEIGGIARRAPDAPADDAASMRPAVAETGIVLAAPADSFVPPEWMSKAEKPAPQAEEFVPKAEAFMPRAEVPAPKVGILARKPRVLAPKVEDFEKDAEEAAPEAEGLMVVEDFARESAASGGADGV